MSQSYNTGTVTVTAGQTSVVGSGTAWALALATGGLFCCQGVSIPCTVVDDTHLTLDDVWPGASGSGFAYSIFRETAQATSAVLANDRLAEAALQIKARTLVNFDEMGTLAQRAVYDSAPKGFVYLDISQPAGFQTYVKQSTTNADWAGPNPFGGIKGDPGPGATLSGGTTTTLAPGSAATSSLTGTGPDYQFNVSLPKGEPAGRKFTFSTTVTDANPGTGFLRFNSTTFASITNLFVSTTDGAAGAATEFLDRMGASSNTDKGLIRVQHADNPAIYREFVVTGVTTATSYRKVAVTPLSSAGTLSNNTVVMITFLATGNKGTDGTGTGDMSKSIYDPANKNGDAFAMANMTEGADAKVMTAAERTKLAGVAAGAQVNAVTSVASKTGAVTLAKGDVGLGNVDNTSDANKPVSTAQQTALNGKLNTSGGTLTGALVLSGAPTIDLHAATKKYVDDKGAGGTLTAPVALIGASVDLTSIPPGAKQITVMISGVTHASGTGNLQVQLGTSSGVDATNYLSMRSTLSSTVATAAATTSFDLAQLGTSAPLRGIFQIYLADSDSNTWMASWTAQSGTTTLYIGSGSKSLSGVLDRIRFLKTSAGDFNAGTVRLLIQ